MALLRDYGVNHALGVTGLESLVRRTRARLRAMPLISLNLQKMAISGSETISALNETVDGHYLTLGKRHFLNWDRMSGGRAGSGNRFYENESINGTWFRVRIPLLRASEADYSGSIVD